MIACKFYWEVLLRGELVVEVLKFVCYHSRETTKGQICSVKYIWVLEETRSKKGKRKYLVHL